MLLGNGMIVQRGPRGGRDSDDLFVFIEEQLPPAFEMLLLNELLAVARSEGPGGALSSQQKSEALLSILEQALNEAQFDAEGRRYANGAYRFGMVDGHHIGVAYLPSGLPSDSPVGVRRAGLPVVVSGDFDRIYGAGALEDAVRIALGVSARRSSVARPARN